MRNGEPVVGQGSRITIVPSGDLTFDPVADDDEGTYQCFARNSAGVDDASITLTVLGNSICALVLVCRSLLVARYNAGYGIYLRLYRIVIKYFLLILKQTCLIAHKFNAETLTNRPT